jgi:hypothetical protein
VKGWQQEPDGVPHRPVLWVLAGVLVSVALCAAVAWVLAGTRPGPRRSGAGVQPDVNAIETSPFGACAQGVEDRERAETWLQSYGWVDRRAGLVHIPIERAIDIYLERRAARAGGAP